MTPVKPQLSLAKRVVHLLELREGGRKEGSGKGRIALRNECTEGNQSGSQKREGDPAEALALAQTDSQIHT